jgi:hypothetical protein
MQQKLQFKAIKETRASSPDIRNNAGNIHAEIEKVMIKRLKKPLGFNCHEWAKYTRGGG